MYDNPIHLKELLKGHLSQSTRVFQIYYKCGWPLRWKREPSD